MSPREPGLAFSFRCDQRWSELEPRAGGRHCSRCERTVLDLGKLTRAQAVAAARRGECGRLQLDVEGRAVFRRAPDRRAGLRALTVLGGVAVGCAGPPHAEPQLTQEPPEIALAAMVPTELEPGMAAIPMGLSVAELEEGSRVELEEAVRSARDAIEPTEEQQRLTRLKHRRRVHGSMVTMPMGVVMVCPTPGSAGVPVW